MIEHVQGPGAGGTQPSPRPQHPPAQKPGAPPPGKPEDDLSVVSEFRNRLGAVAERLEGLLRSYSTLRNHDEGSDEAVKAADLLQREISAAQVAFQNILSTDTTGDPGEISSLPGYPAQGHTLQPQHVLQLLD